MIPIRPFVSGATVAATTFLAISPLLAQNEHLCEGAGDGNGDWGTCASVRYSHDLDAVGDSLEPVAADFTGDHRVDLLMTLGDQPFLSVGAGAMNYESDLPMPPNSSSVSALGSVQFPSRSVPSMLGSLDKGLAVWEVDPATGALSVLTPLGATDWADAQALRSLDLDGDGLDELIGYFEIGTNSKVRLGSWNGDPAVPGSFEIVTKATLDLGGYLTSIHGQSSQGGQPARIVLSAGNRIATFGELLQFKSITFLDDDVIAATPVNDADGQAVAAVTRDSSDTDFLVVVRDGAVEMSIDIGNRGTRAIVSADYLAGAQGDLAILGDEVMLAQNYSVLDGDPFLDADNAEFAGMSVSDLDVPSYWQDAQSDWIVASDIDNDGDSDVMLNWETGYNLDPHYLLVAFNSLVLEGYETARFPVLELVETGHPNSFIRTLTGTISNTGTMVASGATHLEVMIMFENMGTVVELTDLSLAAAGEIDASVTYSMSNIPSNTPAEVLYRPVLFDPISGDVLAAGADFRISITTISPNGVGVPFGVHNGTGSSGGLPGPRNANGGNGPPPPANGG